MNKLIGIAILSAMIVAPATAQTTTPTQTSIQAKPGLIGPDIPIAWGIERAYDSLTKTPGQIAQERAAEALEMQQKNNTYAAEKAINATKQAADKANKNDSKGLQNALNVLNRVQQNNHGKAKGISNAIQAINRARTRQPPSKPRVNKPINAKGKPSNIP